MFFEGEIDTNGITLSSSLKDDIGINSIGMLYMAMALEEEFSIKFTNEDFPTFLLPNNPMFVKAIFCTIFACLSNHKIKILFKINVNFES